MRQGIQERMQLDQYGLYTICSIYFDTDNFQLIRSSLEKPVYKEKLQLRSYGVPEDAQSPVFLELKKKYKGVVYKRRVDMQLEECRNTSLPGSAPHCDGQILHEIDWFPAPVAHLAQGLSGLRPHGLLLPRGGGAAHYL